MSHSNMYDYICETPVVLRSIIKDSSKINSSDVDLIACDSFSEARDKALKIIKNH